MRNTHYILAIVMAVTFALTARFAYAAEEIGSQTDAEYAVSAAYIKNFLSGYVKWPADKGISELSSVDICILGKLPSPTFHKFFDKVSGKSTVKFNVKNEDSWERTVSHCHVVFITPTEEKNLQMILTGLAGKPILTVSNISDFYEKGGMIATVPIDGKIKFIVNKRALNSSGMTVSSDMLELAYKIVE